MKQIGFLALALLVSPSLALAQPAQDGPPMPPQSGGAPSGGMQQGRAQMSQLRMETRSQMLGALTPQHRTLLASVAGRLATSASPDLPSAARELDSALSSQESAAIVQAESAMRSQMRANLPAPPDGNGNRPPSADGPGAGGSSGRTPDPGMTLLRMALAVGGPMRPSRVP